jgi:hypothetical protein
VAQGASGAARLAAQPVAGAGSKRAVAVGAVWRRRCRSQKRSRCSNRLRIPELAHEL